MKVVALYNFKGGVGKTSSCVNLAYEASLQREVSLIWDLDPQGASTFYLDKKAKIKGGLEKLFSRETPVEKNIRKTAFEDLDMIPADLSFRNIEQKLEGMKKSKGRINKILKQIDRDYSRVFLDCPPRLTVFSENIFKAADMVLVPIIPSALSERAWEQVVVFIEQEGYDIKKFRPFFSMVDLRRKLHKETMISFRKSYPRTLLTAIPYAAEMEQMGVKQQPIQAIASRSRSAVAFHALWTEVNGLLKKQ